MDGCYVRNGDGMNFESMSELPTSDPLVWNIDEEAVLDELYGMLTAVDSKQCNNNQLNHMPQMQEPHIVTTLPDTNKLQHFDAYKQPFPLTANHTGSMPILPTQDQSMKYNPIQNSHPRQDFQVPQQQAPPVYPSIPRYPPNHARLNPDTQNIQTSISIPAVEKISPFGSNESTLVTFVDLKSFYEKGQCRLQGKSEQRLDYASSFVRIYLEKPDNVQTKSAFVERSPDAAHILKDNVGQVPLKILPDESEHWIKVNLDDAGSEVYKLSKVKGEERNLFRIGVKLVFKDTNKSKNFYSDSFQVKSKPKSVEGLCEDGEKPVIKVEPELKKRAIKRSRNDEQEVTMPSPLSVGSSVFPEVITDHLEATTANIKQLKVNYPIQTPRGDIAYHFKLKDCPKKLELKEGDLIGFFENSYDGKSEIRPLTCENARYAKLAGVISRSAWLEGKTPGDDDKDPSDVVCVIGVVKVKVRGPVQNGERIYAALSSYPGVAMPERVITQVTSKELTLVGQSLESVKDESPDSVHLVSSFVSILMSIQSQHTNKALDEMRTDLLGNFDKTFRQFKRNLLRGLKWKMLILAIFLTLLGVLLYQLYAPLTALRYWQCSRGSISDSTSSFTFKTSNYQIPKINGKEFHFDDLMDKLDANYKRKSNDKGYRYYLNIDRCAAGGLKFGVRGPEFYVMNKECNAAYYHYDNGYHKYKTGANFLCSFDEGCSNCDTNEQTEEECQSGIKEKQGNASFKFFKGRGKKVFAHGVQVSFTELQKKLNQNINEVPKDMANGKDVYYFYNVKRCFQGAGGPRSFAVIGQCNNSYYYKDFTNEWIKYRSARDFKCSFHNDSTVKTRPYHVPTIATIMASSKAQSTISVDTCLSGIKEKQGNASFTYFSPTLNKEVHAEGVEVTIDELQIKFNQTINKAEEKVVRYFFNLNRCVRNAGGPQFFAVIGECDNSYYYSVSSNEWRKYRSGKNVQCSTPV